MVQHQKPKGIPRKEHRRALCRCIKSSSSKKYPDKRILLKILKVEDQIIGGFAIVEPEYGTIYNLDGSKIISK